MPISDEEAYRQGKRIAQDMMRGSYDPSKDYSDKKKFRTLWLILIGLAIVAVIAILIWQYVF